VYRYRKFTKEEIMNRTNDKKRMLYYAMDYAERNYRCAKEREMFLEGVKFTIKRAIWK
jgi:intein-encoded DNA endonuclease-like protein